MYKGTFKEVSDALADDIKHYESNLLTTRVYFCNEGIQLQLNGWAIYLCKDGTYMLLDTSGG